MSDWVRGPALETILGLKALQPGDELQADLWREYDPSNRGAVIQVKPGYKPARFIEYRAGAVVCSCPCSRTCAIELVPEYVIAWRRPK